jgi:hypothetical protein
MQRHAQIQHYSQIEEVIAGAFIAAIQTEFSSA